MAEISGLEKSKETIRLKVAHVRRMANYGASLALGTGVLAGVEGGHTYNMDTRIGALGAIAGGGFAINRERKRAKKTCNQAVVDNNRPPKPIGDGKLVARNISPVRPDPAERFASLKTYAYSYLLADGAALISRTLDPNLPISDRAGFLVFGLPMALGGLKMLSNAQQRLDHAEKELIWRLNPDPEPAQPQLPN